MSTLLVSFTLKVEKDVFEEVSFASSERVQQVIKWVVEKHSLHPPEESQYQLFIPPNSSSPKGKFLESYAKLQSVIPPDIRLVELKCKGYPIKLAVYESHIPPTSTTSLKKLLTDMIELKVDFTDPITEWIKVMMKIFLLKPKQEYCFQRILITPRNTIEVYWLNANISLREQGVTPDSYILLIPSEVLTRLGGVRNVPGIEKQGWVSKWSHKDGKETPLYQRYIVLTSNFLFYYKTPNDNTPCGVITLEYYSVDKMPETRKKNAIELNNTSLGFTHDHPLYRFAVETEKEINSWFEILLFKCSNGANKVFGVPLLQIVSRKNNRGTIPDIMNDIFQALDDGDALSVEGLFRISGSASEIDLYRKKYDSGTVPNISGCEVHTLTGLLKLYIRELPEPLLTYHLYQRFIDSWNEADNLEEKKIKIGEVVNLLPEANKRTMRVLLRYLEKVAKYSDKNMMTPKNLAIVFAPNLMKPPKQTSEQGLQNIDSFSVSSAITDIIEFLILGRSELFGDLKESSLAFWWNKHNDVPDTPVIVPRKAERRKQSENVTVELLRQKLADLQKRVTSLSSLLEEETVAKERIQKLLEESS